jgi:hypothetical protein
MIIVYKGSKRVPLFNLTGITVHIQRAGVMLTT